MPDIILRISTQAIAVNMQGRGPIGPPGTGGDAVKIQGVDVSDTAPTDGQILAYDATEDEYVPTDPSAASLPPAASQVEAEAGTETALRSWSPLRVGQSAAAKVGTHAALTTGVHGVGAGTVAKTADIPSAYTSNPEALGTAGAGNSTAWARGNHVHPTTGLALAGAAPTAHAASHITGDAIQNATASQAGLATAAQITKLDGIEAQADVTDATNVAAAGAVMKSLVTTAGDRIRATGNATVERVPATSALADATAGGWSPALKSDVLHTVTRSGILTGITPSGLENGEGCLIRVSGAYATNTTGITAAWSGALDDIAAAVVWLAVWRIGNTYYGSCVEGV